jgi:hypothetical protein
MTAKKSSIKKKTVSKRMPKVAGISVLMTAGRSKIGFNIPTKQALNTFTRQFKKLAAKYTATKRGSSRSVSRTAAKAA